jgi:predicted RNase H-like HicB family nuclease
MRLEIMVRADHTGYEAVCRDLPGCSTRGQSRDEVVRRIRELVLRQLDELRQRGLPLPAGNRAYACEILQLEVG